MDGMVGASILSIITESLYDKPIVVFREYIQNSVDSFNKTNYNGKEASAKSIIKYAKKRLSFLDNGSGISPDIFLNKMLHIASSTKTKKTDIGYKGIGRLSGIPYCKNLTFINIVSFSNGVFQKYYIDGTKLEDIKNSDKYGQMSFSELMSRIGVFTEQLDKKESLQVKSMIQEYIKDHNSMFAGHDTGFLVILDEIKDVLHNTLMSDDFLDSLGWLLPVPFENELLENTEESTTSKLFKSLSTGYFIDDLEIVPAKGYCIYYEDKQITRPIKADMLRFYTCKFELKQYAVGFITFNRDRIALERKNPFSGIRIYIDNILLCDENELIPMLEQYSFFKKSEVYELVQSVRGIGAMIYIVDKVNISANARRTFFEVTDYDSIHFMELLSQFVRNIFDARYALSDYRKAKNSKEIAVEKFEYIRKKALEALQTLAQDKITIDVKDEPEVDFEDLSVTEQRQVIKKLVARELSNWLKSFFSQARTLNPKTAIEDFKIWFKANF